MLSPSNISFLDTIISVLESTSTRFGMGGLVFEDLRQRGSRGGLRISGRSGKDYLASTLRHSSINDRMLRYHVSDDVALFNMAAHEWRG